MKFDFTEVLLFQIIIQGLIFLLSMFGYVGVNERNKYFIIFVICIVLHFGNILILKAGILNMPNLGLAFGLAYGPLIHIYTTSTIQNEVPPIQKTLWKFAPSMLLFIWIIIQSLSNFNTSQFELMSLSLFTIVQILYFTFKSNSVISTYRKNLLIYRSNYDEGIISWLRFFTNSLLVLFALIILNSIALFNALLGAYQLTMLLITCTVLYILIKYFLLGLHGKQVFYLTEVSNASKDDQVKYGSSNLTQEQSSLYQEQIITKMREERLYLDEDLTLKSLSEKLNISDRHISQVINEKLNSNFYDFVNGFRITEAQRLLSERDDVRISEVMYAIGFKTRSSFNSEFKKRTGMSPKYYRQNSKKLDA